MTPVTVSLINMKGGVGKTTLAFNLACYAAFARELRVLAVDLDPQANLSQCFLREAGYFRHITQNRPTTAELFEQVIPPTTGVPSASPAGAAEFIHWWRPRLDVVPSRIELSAALRDPQGKDAILARFLADQATDYDLVIIDCAPTESVLTAAAYRASRYVIVPVRPEYLATVGFPMLARSLEEFKAGRANQSIDIAGVVFNGGDRENPSPEQRASVNRVRRFARTNGWHVFRNAIHSSRSYPRGSRAGRPVFWTKHARRTVKDEFYGVAREFVRQVGLS